MHERFIHHCFSRLAAQREEPYAERAEKLLRNERAGRKTDAAVADSQREEERRRAEAAERRADMLSVGIPESAVRMKVRSVCRPHPHRVSSLALSLIIIARIPS